MFNVLFAPAMATTLGDSYEAQVTALRDFLIASETKLKVLVDSTRSIAQAFHNIALGIHSIHTYTHYRSCISLILLVYRYVKDEPTFTSTIQ